MASKWILFSVLVVAVSAATIQRYDRQDRYRQEEDQERHSDPNYVYQYAVRDGWSGDWKSQHESRLGDRVRGQYRMMESDGTERIVDYSADDRNGFNAVVRHEPHWHQHPVPVLAEVRPFEVHSIAVNDEHRLYELQQEALRATSNMHFRQHYPAQPWLIANRIHHN